MTSNPEVTNDSINTPSTCARVSNMEGEYVYQWIDANDNLTVGSVDESTGEKLAITLNVTVDSGDTGLIGGLL